MAPPPNSTSELVPSLPFPIESIAAFGAAGGWHDPLTPLVAPLVPASAFAAEAITADSVDMVPAEPRPPVTGDAETSQRRAAVPPPGGAPPAPTAGGTDGRPVAEEGGSTCESPVAPHSLKKKK